MRRGYLIALLAAGLLAVGYVVVPKVAHAVAAHEAKDRLVAALDDLRKLKVPSDLVPLTSNCSFYRCYHISAQPTPQAAERIVRDMLTSTGATPSPPPSMCVRRRTRYGPIVDCSPEAGRLHGQSIIVFLRFYEAFRNNHYVLPLRGSEVDIAFDCAPSDAD